MQYFHVLVFHVAKGHPYHHRSLIATTLEWVLTFFSPSFAGAISSSGLHHDNQPYIVRSSSAQVSNKQFALALGKEWSQRVRPKVFFIVATFDN